MSEILTLVEAAKVLSVSAPTLTRWTRARLIATIELPPARGKRPVLRFRREDLEAFLIAKRRPARGGVQRPSREQLRREYPALVLRTRPTFALTGGRK